MGTLRYKNMHTIIAALAAALLIAAPFAANAQDEPSYAQGSGDGQIRGRIVSFDGAYNLQVRDDKGYIDNVELHQGTIINPTGLTLAPGMVVSILGYNAGDNFAANEIDTPYNIDNGYAYYGGHPWSYYGPGISLGFFFGNVGWWHGGYFGGPYHYYGGVRVYNNVNFNAVYRVGGSYGRAYGYGQPGYGTRVYENNTYHTTYNNNGGGYRSPAYNGNRPAYNGGNRPAYNGYHAAPGESYHQTTGVYRAPAENRGGGEVRGGGGERGGDRGGDDHGHR